MHVCICPYQIQMCLYHIQCTCIATYQHHAYAERARTFMITASHPYMHTHTHEHKHTHAPGSPRHGRFSLHFFVTVQYLLRYTSTAAATEKARQSSSARVCSSRNTARSRQSPPLPTLSPCPPSPQGNACLQLIPAAPTSLRSVLVIDKTGLKQEEEGEGGGRKGRVTWREHQYRGCCPRDRGGQYSSTCASDERY